MKTATPLQENVALEQSNTTTTLHDPHEICNNIITYGISAVYLAEIKEATKGGIGPRFRDASPLRERGDDEGSKRHLFTGACGEWALAMWLDGHPEEFFRRRAELSLHPDRGDGGRDHKDYYFDAKTSLRKVHNRSPLRFHLLAVDHEVKPGHVYVFVLLDLFDNYTAAAHLVGWRRGEWIRQHGEQRRDCWAVPAAHLLPMMPMPRVLR